MNAPQLSSFSQGSPSNAVIPVLVTGIQPRRVGAVNELVSPLNESSAPKDLGALDSCDKHRNDGEVEYPIRKSGRKFQ
jgi:hypothetical protein